MAESEIQREKFRQLLEQIKTHVQTIKKKNRELNRENMRLRNKLEELQKGQSDIFSAISESERIAMRHKVNGLIEKIDKHLES
jgi:cell division septum initiation protein DivIVA